METSVQEELAENGDEVVEEGAKVRRDKVRDL